MSSAAASAAPTDAKKPTEQDLEMRRRAVAGKLTYAAFGEIVSVLVQAPQYRALLLADLEWLVMPALLNRQFSMVQVTAKQTGVAAPAGLVMWASVSDEIEQAMMAKPGQLMKLTREQRRSGSNHWITDAVGDKQMLELAIKNLRQKVFGAAPVKTIMRAADGKILVAQL